MYYHPRIEPKDVPEPQEPTMPDDLAREVFLQDTPGDIHFRLVRCTNKNGEQWVATSPSFTLINAIKMYDQQDYPGALYKVLTVDGRTNKVTFVETDMELVHG